jgi:hypothetical protein
VNRKEIVQKLKEARVALRDARKAGESKEVQASMLKVCETYQTMLDAWDANFKK